MSANRRSRGQLITGIAANADVRTLRDAAAFLACGVIVAVIFCLLFWPGAWA